MKFIKIYNDDFTYNSLLNTRYIFKINDNNISLNLKNNEKYYQIEYYLGYRVEYAFITENDYLELTTKIEIEIQKNEKDDEIKIAPLKQTANKKAKEVK